MSVKGTIIAAHGRHYEVETGDGERLHAVTRGKRSDYACGDQLDIEPTGAGQGCIIGHAPRHSLLYRSDAWKQKLIAANVEQVAIVTATEPAFSTELVSRAIAAAEHEGMRVIIVLNKCDLTGSLPAAREQLNAFKRIGYPVIEISAKHSVKPLQDCLDNLLTVLVGQSGMGKSTVINGLVPGAHAATREISTALDSGKHTTTHATLYRLGNNAAIIDSPGLQEFGLSHLTFGELEWAFREFRSTLGKCRFHDCHHRNEPGCAVKALVDSGDIDRRRYEHFCAISSA